MSISVKEIQKGSLLLYKGDVKIVQGINQYILFEGDKVWIGGGEIDPVPLSEEWIGKFGFVQKDPELNAWTNGKMTIFFQVNQFHLGLSGCIYVYVHQLQIVHFIITGEHLVLPKIKNK